jgi:hypothetical protein
MNKKQKKARIKYLKRLQKGPDPKEIRKRKMLGFMLPQQEVNWHSCLECIYSIPLPPRPRALRAPNIYCVARKSDKYLSPGEIMCNQFKLLT